ncbi:hypothetical protein D6X88_07695 [Listeria monocytogenes]|nr:hypothetical protein [Listeria monocytogenes]EAC6072725.1 hypothetical protein [Listeria monocytogenes]EAD2977198.1 hypothetical protein [Listeria monocytogenes]EAD6326869.1 hypothetical protein [Listeria monocytogenes]EAD8191045.1 hypothetical protein [Listeria monocytogenes]
MPPFIGKYSVDLPFDSNFVACFFNVASLLLFHSFLRLISVYNNETLSLIIAPHAFSFCERFVNLCLGNWLKHVFYVSILSTFSLKNKKTL